MARVTIEDCLKNVDSRFALVHLAVRRVLQLRGGAPSFVSAPKNKEVVLALREIASGKVNKDNIKQLEDMRPAPEAVAREREEVTRLEVKEILDDAAQFDAAIALDQADQIVEQDQDED